MEIESDVVRIFKNIRKKIPINHNYAQI
jgi:hypothetical protein